MALYNKYVRNATVDIPRFLEFNGLVIIDGQLLDGATLVRKTDKFIEPIHDRNCLQALNNNKLTTSGGCRAYGNKSAAIENCKYWIVDSTNPNIVYFSTFNSSGGYINKVDLSTYAMTSVAVGNEATNIITFVGQDATYLYGIIPIYYYYYDGGTRYTAGTRIIKIKKSDLSITASGGDSNPGANAYNTWSIVNYKILKTDQSSGYFVVWVSHGNDFKNIIRTAYATLPTVTYLTNSSVNPLCHCDTFPTDPDENRNFWCFCPALTATLEMYYYQPNSDWSALTQNVTCTINWNGFTATDVTTDPITASASRAVAYTNFLVSPTKVLTVRSINDPGGSNPTPQYNRWWVWDVTTPNSVTLLNTGAFTNNPNYTTCLEKAPDGRFYMWVKDSGIQFFNFINNSNALIESTFIPMNNALSFTFDSFGRLWYELPDYGMYIIDATTSIDVTMTLDSSLQTYAGINLSNNINLSAWTYQGVRVASGMYIYVSGNAVFTNNNSKIIQVTTNDSADTVIPITVTGPGMITFSAKPV